MSLENLGSKKIKCKQHCFRKINNMNDKLLVIKNLTVEVANKKVLKGVNLEIGEGEVVVVMGANGEGKSTLVNTLLGNSEYVVSEGRVMMMGEDLLGMSVDERSRVGLFVAYQNPVEVPGVKIFNFCKTMVEAQGGKIASVVDFRSKLEGLMEKVGLSREYVGREVNVGFSGGEKKRLEMLQMLLLSPKLVILDEVDSGLDKEGRELMRELVGEMSQNGVGVMVISQYEDVLSGMKVDRKLVMKRGRLWDES